MARPQTITNDQILAAAREVFAESGFTATTAEIARRAGISEGTLFKRFATKEALFEEVIGLHDVPAWFGRLRDLPDDADLHGVLCGVARDFIAQGREVMPRLLMLWSRGHTPPLPHPPDTRDPMDRAARELAGFFRRETARGRLTPDLDADAVSRAFMGMLMQFVMLEIVRPDSLGGIDAERYIDSCVRTLWCGLAPPDSVHSPHPSKG